MRLRRDLILRVIAAVVALAPFTLCVLHLASLVSIWTGDPGTRASIARWVIPSRIVRLLAWGVGFSVLALVITW